MFREYDDAQRDGHWLWSLLIERAYHGIDNKSRTDNFLLPGEVQTDVQAVDPASGKPTKLSRYGVMP